LAEDQRRQAVIVAKDRRLLRIDIGDCVILVHDGNSAQLEQALKSLAQNAVAFQVSEVVFGDQHLRDLDGVRAERLGVSLHQLALADSRAGGSEGGTGKATGVDPNSAAPSVIAPELTSTSWRPAFTSPAMLVASAATCCGSNSLCASHTTP